MRLSVDRNRIILVILGALVSGFLLVLSFPKFDHAWLVWISLVPFLLSLANSGPGLGFILSFLCGFIFFPGVFSWILEIPGYRLFHHAVLGTYLSLYFAFFGLAFSLVATRWSKGAALLGAPFFWVALEYTRANLGFMALPWAFLGHSQHQYLPIVQVSSLTGAYGVSFLIVLMNAAITGLAIKLSEKRKSVDFFEKSTLSGRGTTGLVSAAVGLTAISLWYGNISLSKPLEGKSIKISVLQGNIEQSKKWDRKYADFIIQKYLDLSRKAADEEPLLIAWPEASTPGFILRNMSQLNMLNQLIKETKTFYLIGSAEYPKLDGRGRRSQGIGNTAIFFSPDAKVLNQYVKIWLVPFREYIPYVDTVPWPAFVVPQGARFYEKQGSEFTLFDLEGSRFGVVICWEGLFPGLFRQFVKKGASFIVNITNEAAFGDQAFPYQFLAISIFRAVENRVFLVRAANTGISCFIDPYGRITARLEKDGRDIFIDGHLSSQVLVSQGKTFYTQYGDLFAYICFTVSILVIAVCSLRKQRR